MTIAEIVRLASKTGIDLILVSAGIWVVWYLVKNTVIRLGNLLDKLSDKIENIGKSLESHDRDSDTRGQFIKKEHDALLESHKDLQAQHQEMIKILGRINGFKDNG